MRHTYILLEQKGLFQSHNICIIEASVEVLSISCEQSELREADCKFLCFFTVETGQMGNLSNRTEKYYTYIQKYSTGVI